MSPERKSILIIDDDARNIFALSAVLKAKGFSICSAAGAHEGLARLEKDASIGVVLMDMMMPEMDGYQALAYIRQDEKLQYLPVIALTAQAMVGDRERCLEAGANGYISKPVDIDKLMIELTKYL
jgi:CheY-like chemotaxis protein